MVSSRSSSAREVNLVLGFSSLHVQEPFFTSPVDLVSSFSEMLSPRPAIMFASALAVEFYTNYW